MISWFFLQSFCNPRSYVAAEIAALDKILNDLEIRTAVAAELCLQYHKTNKIPKK